ncbi:Hypothetical Protein FCC1311_082642 [Hondaea fermentalgiana]|uniref:Uncharacterized protein n=1 Tax=Hondaea fermentalgiana TaxID=2315210 RepID=A0A2R5GP00_9STRA|nr:Hypothetical Protein FCC1311_082642 [Hondaea fermentalgiana]|eukprot:GBG32039.1 Hypothetical Protein FCC1311_082642 [Hondaea fermentalgiana]
MFNALRLSMELALFSILGLGVIVVFWAPRVFLPMEPRWHVNVENKEPHFGMASASIPVLTPALTLRVVLGRGTMVPMAYMQAVVSVAIGFLLYAVLYLFPADTDGRKLFLVAAVIPFFKEAAYAGARSLAKHMAFSPKICIPGRRLRRELSWVIHLWVQIMMGLAVRLFVSRFETTTTLTAAVATQSAFEIFSRVTMNWRDRQMSRFFKIVFHQKDAAAVVVPSNLQRSLRHLPFDMYAQHEKFLAHPLNRRTLLSGMALQLAAELAVDTICLHYEHAAGFDVMSAWRLRPPYLVWLLIWAAWYASMACYSIVSDLDHFDQCQVGNMCKCAFGHGPAQRLLAAAEYPHSYNHVAFKAWKKLNPHWNFAFITFDNIAELAPLSHALWTGDRNANGRQFSHLSDLTRVELLCKNGGVWADASLMPMVPLDDFIAKELEKPGRDFLMYRFTNPHP